LKQGDNPTLTNNDLSLIRHNIHRARLSVHPPLPSCIEELHTMEIETNIGEQFLFVNDKENSIVGFSTEQNIKMLCDVKKIYVDASKAVQKNLHNFLPYMVLKMMCIYLLCFFYCPTS